MVYNFFFNWIERDRLINQGNFKLLRKLVEIQQGFYPKVGGESPPQKMPKHSGRQRSLLNQSSDLSALGSITKSKKGLGVFSSVNIASSKGAFLPPIAPSGESQSPPSASQETLE